MKGWHVCGLHLFRDYSGLKSLVNNGQFIFTCGYYAMQWYADCRHSQRGRKLQWVTADSVLDNLFCHLTPSELAALWCPIVDAVDPSHWNRSDDEVYLNLRQASLDLISKMINGLHVGIAAHRATNTQARFRMLQAITRTDDLAPWPRLPTDDSLYPTTVDGWKAYKQHYPVCQDDVNFARFFRCFGKDGATLFTSITGNDVGEVLATIEKEHHDVHDDRTTPGNSAIDSTSDGQTHTAAMASTSQESTTAPLPSTSQQSAIPPMGSASQQSSASESDHTGPPLSVPITAPVCILYHSAGSFTG
jgi:hypothetical protein